VRIRFFAARFWIANREQDAQFFSFLGEQLAGTVDVRANGATNYVMQLFHKLLRNWFPVSRKASMAGYSMWMTTLFLFACGNALALALGAYLWSTNVISIGTVYLIFYYTNLLNDPMEQIRAQLLQLQQAGAGIR
jgi:ATP-binding cassette subfamily B protein